MTQRLIVTLIIIAALEFSSIQMISAQPILSFANRSAIRFEKILKVGEVEILDFASPVSLAHYGTNEDSLDYIELEKLEAENKGFRKFMVKAKKAGIGELTFKSGEELIKIKILVEDDYSGLEKDLNDLFGIKNSSPEERIQVISANIINNSVPIEDSRPHIYLKGLVSSAKEAMLAVAFAANALGDHGVKIFSNPGGQLRLKDLDIKSSDDKTNQVKQDSSFVEFYESTNKLIDTNNLYRDLLLASENERVISYIRIKEPRRFVVKVRFLEMDSKYVDEFVNTINTTVTGNDIRGAFGSNDVHAGNINKVSDLSGIISSDIFRSIDPATGLSLASQGIPRLTNSIIGGNLASGAVKLVNNAFLNFNFNDLLQEGILRVVNEFSLITHSGEMVSIGKGTRFPVPKQNNGVGNSAISFEYIPIGFKGELKVTSLENNLIDVQLASRLSAAESSVATVQGISIPIFSEEYVNSGALLNDSQEVVLNAFLTETEALSKSTSPLGRIVPFMGRSKHKRKSKNLLFISLSAEEIKPSSQQNSNIGATLPHIDFTKGEKLFADYSNKLRNRGVTDTVDLGIVNQNKINDNNNSEIKSIIDPLSEEGLEL